jgi:hypothetical protein
VFGVAVSSPAANAAAKADLIGKKIGELVDELQPFWRDLMDTLVMPIPMALDRDPHSW